MLYCDLFQVYITNVNIHLGIYMITETAGSNEKITRAAQYDYGPKDPTIDYNRLIFNYLRSAIRVADGAGRITIVEPEPSPYYNDTKPRIEIKEWFKGTSTDKFHGLPPMGGQPLSGETGILITTSVDPDLLITSPSGVYIEETGLHLSLVVNHSKAVHPHLTPATARQRLDTRGSGMTIEILDPSRKYPTLYTTIGSTTYKVIPQRTPTPSSDGIRITRWDGTIGKPVYGLYDLLELTRGPGKFGIRMYPSEAESVTDIRAPAPIGLLKEAKVILHNAEITKVESAKVVKDLEAREAAVSSASDRIHKLEAKIAADKLDLRTRISDLQGKADIAEGTRQTELSDMVRKRDKLERDRTEEQATTSRLRDKLERDRTEEQATTSRLRDKLERDRTEERARLRKEYTELEEKISERYEKKYLEKVKKLDLERETLVKSVQKSTEERLHRTFHKEIDLERAKRRKVEEDARVNKHTEKKERWGFFSKVLQLISTAFIVYKTIFA